MNTKVFRGLLIKFLFINEMGWGIGLFLDENNKNQQMRIKGPIGQMRLKVVYEIQGFLDEHPKYGQSFEVQSFKVADSTTIKQAIAFWTSGLFPTVGAKTAQIIVENLGIDAAKKIRQDPDLIKTVPGVSEKVAQIIISVVSKVDAEQELLEIFTMNGLKVSFLQSMLKWHEDKNEISAILESNFYDYARKNNFQPFLEVDKVALYFGAEQYGPQRVGAWVYETINNILFTTGDTHTKKNILIEEVQKRLAISYDTIMAALVYCKEEKSLIFNDHKIYSFESWNDEELINNNLAKIKKREPLLNNNQIDFEDLLSQVEKEIGNNFKIDNFHYDEIQISALKAFIHNNIIILTGGPGTGKTMVINGMVRIFEKIYGSQNFALAAPTGRAASRIQETTGYKATTIHKLLKASGDDSFEVNETNPIFLDLIILDESSMLSNHLFSDFLRGTGQAKKLVLVGDVDQLPSVGYGNLFEDLIISKNFPTITLNKIFRQSEQNDIIELAAGISRGDTEEFKTKKLNNIDFLFSDNNQENIENMIKIYQNKIATQDVNNINHVQILAPFYKGDLGINIINNIIQENFNKNSKISGKIFKKGETKITTNDKVMYLKNDSVLEISNGDIGIIGLMKFENARFVEAICEFNGRDVNLKNANFAELTLGYGISVHKSQGSEYNNVILVLDPSANNHFLSKKIIYTAITRAKEHLYVIGGSQAFWNGLAKTTKPRNTTLVEKILKINQG
ncbi:SF1B family DNA helicase RecD2 [Spiroplasma alleghenense]|uniref:Exodeoxyribonuclease V subunit alpha n=1 Tax=Spiroplasma alleghenense TaxID=216931 RepID=A0A345Z3N9_9MOLU|nr:AAA family ATPase [Spiroplasma alleghenense]AXK51218.1 exodeoxyribonuclease V subunit alpha [Spiroplasma alleghenense]